MGSTSDFNWRKMRLHMVRGSFVTTPEDDDYCPMDPAVWGKMPEDILWEVMRFVPGAAQFRLRAVNRKWRRVLTSREFRKQVRATAAATMRQSSSEEEGEEQQKKKRVVACVDVTRPRGDAYGNCNNSGASSSKGHRKKVVEIDLSSFVPRSFWKSKSYSVVAAADGLVCISNDSERQHWSEQEASSGRGGDPFQLKPSHRRGVWAQGRCWANRYCVLNPLTRSGATLPALPFQPHGWHLRAGRPGTTTTGAAAAVVTIYTYTPDAKWKVATCALGAGAGPRRWVVEELRHPWFPHPLYGGALTVCPGGGYWWLDETFAADRALVFVLAPAAVADAGDDGVDAPRAAPPCLDPFHERVQPCHARGGGHGLPGHPHHGHTLSEMFLVPHPHPRAGAGGGVLLVAQTQPWPGARCAVACGAWRLAADRDPMEWAEEAQLTAGDLEAVTGLAGLQDGGGGHFPPNFFQRNHFHLVAAYAVRELLCCLVQVYSERADALCTFLLAFNLDSRRWELVHELERREGAAGEVEEREGVGALARDALRRAVPMELRPDLFLSYSR